MRAIITYNGEASTYRVPGAAFKRGQSKLITDRKVIELAQTSKGFNVRITEEPKKDAPEKADDASAASTDEDAPPKSKTKSKSLHRRLAAQQRAREEATDK